MSVRVPKCVCDHTEALHMMHGYCDVYRCPCKLYVKALDQRKYKFSCGVGCVKGHEHFSPRLHPLYVIQPVRKSALFRSCSCDECNKGLSSGGI